MVSTSKYQHSIIFLISVSVSGEMKSFLPTQVDKSLSPKNCRFKDAYKLDNLTIKCQSFYSSGFKPSTPSIFYRKYCIIIYSFGYISAL